MSVAVDTKGSGKGLGTFCTCGLVEPSCAVAVGETAVGVGMGVSRPPEIQTSNLLDLVKDGAYYCYCAYVLRISRYSGFLWVVPTNTGIILRGLKLYGESRT